ncbi:MAG: stage II sporulation protein M [Psychroflexus sp.]|jgi:uncharacterized membrane protein SpoIIM required for sporulation|nr:stage II sporulation protein M [Psychroflexus sp.]MDR9448020.1 stage II sporulation protein M [Psychroflexus sp.]
MREAAFVKNNKSKWQSVEKKLYSTVIKDIEELKSIYLDITEDLSYAQTHYPSSTTTQYLNDIAARAHQKVYRSKPASKNKILNFYKYEFPLMFSKYHPQLILAFTVFLFFSLIGAYSAAVDDSFVRLILGDTYVNMTLENIKEGDPMKVYKEANQIDMFLGITVNNIRVGLIAFAFGILAGLGTFFIAMQNAIMLGSFQYFFAEKGLLWESARTIWIHGTIEISVIIICTCAGFVIGKSMLMPGTYKRMKAFLIGVKDALKIVMSTIPFFIIAGLLEGFVTRLTGMHDILAIFIIGSSLFIIIFYYVIYPIQLKKKYHAGQL